MGYWDDVLCLIEVGFVCEKIDMCECLVIYVGFYCYLYCLVLRELFSQFFKGFFEGFVECQ